MPKCRQFSHVSRTWTAPIIHEIMLHYLQEKKITFGTWKQIHVDKKRRLNWTASSLGGQASNFLKHLQQWLGRHSLENILNIGPVPTYPWHQLAPVYPTFECSGLIMHRRR